MVEAAIVRGDVVGVEEKAFLYCGLYQPCISPISIGMGVWHTPLEACHRSGHLDTASKEIGKSGKDGEQQQPQCSRACKQERFVLVDSHLCAITGTNAP